VVVVWVLMIAQTLLRLETPAKKPLRFAPLTQLEH
jgi:hypothetical protein